MRTTGLLILGTGALLIGVLLADNVLMYLGITIAFLGLVLHDDKKGL